MFKQFNSLTQFSTWLQETPAHPDAADSSWSTQPTQDWDLGLGYNGTVDKLRKGGLWPEGARQLRKASLSLLRPRQQQQPAVRRSQVGSAPAVAAYLRGDPRNMRRVTPAPMPSTPVLRVGVNTGTSAWLDSSARVNVGAGWLAVIRELETKGFRCHVEAVCCMATERQLLKPATNKWFDCRVVVKHADQPLNLHQLAFVLAHPAFNRRAMFKAREILTPALTKRGYGSNNASAHRAAHMKKHYDIWTPPLTPAQPHATPEKALDWISGLVTTQLKEKGLI